MQKQTFWMALIAVAIIASLIGYFVAPKAFGASGTRFPNGLSTDSTSPSAGQVRTTTLTATGAATVGSTLDVTGAATAATTTVSGPFQQGGDGCSITDANGGTYTLTEAEMLHCSYFKLTASGAGQETVALTLPATSTMTTLLSGVGDSRRWIYDASAVAAATTTTLTLGTGIDLIGVTTNDDVIDGAEFAEIICWRQPDTDVTCLTSELVHTD